MFSTFSTNLTLTKILRNGFHKKTMLLILYFDTYLNNLFYVSRKYKLHSKYHQQEDNEILNTGCSLLIDIHE
jgi:hypothetical protein